MSCTEGCGNITLFGGKDGKTIHNGEGPPSLGNPNTGDFYIDTINNVIYGPYDGSWGAGTSIVGPEGQPGPQGSPGINGQDGQDGQDGVDSNSNYGNTLFVDKVYGNNLTAQRERFDLPYATISEALVNANNYDTIIVRSGTYTETLTLKNLVNIHFEKGAVLSGRIVDNDLSVTSDISGEGVFKNQNNLIEITGADSKVNIKCDVLSCYSTPILIRPISSGTCNVTIECRAIIGIGANYGSTVQGNPTVNIIVHEKIETLVNTSNTIGLILFQTGTFSGYLNIRTPRVFMGNSSNENAGILFFDGEGDPEIGTIVIDIDDVDITYDGPNDDFGIIHKKSATKSRIRIGKLRSKTRTVVVVEGNHGTSEYTQEGSLFLEGKFYSEKYLGIHYMSNQRLVVSNSVFKVGSSGRNLPEVVLIGNNSDHVFRSGTNTDNQITLMNTKFIKDTGGLEVLSGSIILKTVLGTPNILNCYLELQNSKASPVTAISKDNSSNDQFFVSDTVGNIDNRGAYITHLKTTGDNYYFSADFRIYEDLR